MCSIETQMNEIYNRFERERIGSAMIKFDLFTVNGKKTCSAWAGSENHERLACVMLRSKAFGTRHVCVYTGNALNHDENGFFEPDSKCPLWGKENK